MSAIVTIVAGSTAPIKFQLVELGVPINLTDFTVTLILTASDGSVVSTAGKVVKTSAVNGEVTYTPAALDLSAALSPYKARWKFVEDTGAISYVPTSYRDEWDVVPE